MLHYVLHNEGGAAKMYVGSLARILAISCIGAAAPAAAYAQPSSELGSQQNHQVLNEQLQKLDQLVGPAVYVWELSNACSSKFSGLLSPKQKDALAAIKDFAKKAVEDISGDMIGQAPEGLGSDVAVTFAGYVQGGRHMAKASLENTSLEQCMAAMDMAARIAPSEDDKP
jgi:hypothetical protein